MLNDIQKIMMTRRMLWTEEREDWRRKGGLQRHRGREIADEREGEKWLIFALWCLWYLCNHAATLIQPIWLNCMCDKREARYMHTEIKSFRKTGWKKCNRLRETQIDTEENEVIGIRTRMWRKSPSFPRCWWISRSQGWMWVMLKGMWIGLRRHRKGNGVKTCRRKARHDKVLNHMSLIARCAWLQPALSPCVLVREKSRTENAVCVDVGKIDGRGRREGKRAFWHG